MAYDQGMSENPFRSPTAVGVRTGSQEEVYNVAKYQKGVIACLGIQILAGLGFAFLLPVMPPVFIVVYYLVVIALQLASTVLVFLLAINVYSTGTGIVLGLLALIPCLGLLILLIINGKATSILRKNGIKVGFLGADMSQFERAP